MMELKKEVAVNTKMFQGDDAIRTNLTIDASNLTVEEMFEYVIDSAVIKWQSAIRRKKDSVIPAKAVYVVPKPGTRAVATMSDDEMLAKLLKSKTPEQIMAELKAKVAKNDEAEMAS